MRAMRVPPDFWGHTHLFWKKHVVCSLTQKIEKSEGIWNLESQKFQQFQKFQCAHTMRALDIGMLSSSDTQVFGDL